MYAFQETEVGKMNVVAIGLGRAVRRYVGLSNQMFHRPE